jgi:hypothetical protein
VIKKPLLDKGKKLVCMKWLSAWKQKKRGDAEDKCILLSRVPVTMKLLQPRSSMFPTLHRRGKCVINDRSHHANKHDHKKKQNQGEN